MEFIESRIRNIQAALRQDPLALSDEGRLAAHAILWNLTTLADAAGRLSDELKKRHPEIPWDQVRGFRNVATHAYERLHLKQIGVIINKDLPLVRTAVEQELGARNERTPSEGHGGDQQKRGVGREGGDRTASPEQRPDNEMER